MKHYLTASDLAPKLKVTPTHINRLARRGELPALRVGGAWRFDEDEVDEYIRRSNCLRALREWEK